MLPTGKAHISYSELSCWMECSWRHKLQHVAKINLSNPSIHLVFGTAAHMAVQNLLQTGISTTDDAREYIVKELEKYNDIPELATIDVDILVKSIQNILDDIPVFFNENFPGWELVSIEESLYEEVQQFFAAHGELFFKGFIDVIIKVPGKKDGTFFYWILDLKTANRPWSLDKIKDSRVRMQLVLYKKFWTTKHNIPLKLVRCGFVTLLKSGKPGKLCKLIPISVGEKSAEKSLKILNNSLSSIKRGMAIKNRNACRFCDYKNTEHCT